jgi:hypothetical protein
LAGGFGNRYDEIEYQYDTTTLVLTSGLQVVVTQIHINYPLLSTQTTTHNFISNSIITPREIEEFQTPRKKKRTMITDQFM